MELELFVIRNIAGNILLLNREQDKLMPNLTWQFPNLTKKVDEEQTNELRTQLIEQKFGIQVNSIASLGIKSTYDKNPDISREYFSANHTFGEVRLDPTKYWTHDWWRPTDITSLFTTSYDLRIEAYLNSL